MHTWKIPDNEIRTLIVLDMKNVAFEDAMIDEDWCWEESDIKI